MALNRAFLRDINQLDSWKSRGISQNLKCVFISHQKEDKDICRKIADYLTGAGIDVYFDEYDLDLKIANQTQDSKAVTKAILKGVNYSTHMLCVVSPNTLDSKWVPFEIGFGYDKTQLGVLLLKGIKKEQLPDYIRAVNLIIPDIYDLNIFIAKTERTTKELLESKGMIRNYNFSLHPLLNVMETINVV
jgi:TIR domain